MAIKKSPKVAKMFTCENCDYKCSKKSDYAKHLSTGKHKRLTNTAKILPEKSPNEYDCVCGKSYKHRQSYFNHKKTCTYIEEKEENAITQNSGGVDNELVMQLIAVNKELINIINKINVKKHI